MTSGLEAGIVLEKMSKDYPMFVQSLLLPNALLGVSHPSQPKLSPASLLLLPLASFLEQGIPAARRSSWMSPLLPVHAGSPAFPLALLLLHTEAITSAGRAKVAPKPAPKLCFFFQPNHSLES